MAVHPDDERFTHLVGQRVRVPTTDRLVPVVADDVIKMDFGAGALKVTPGHSEIDFEIGKRHGLPVLSILNPDGSLNELAGAYAGLDRFVAKKQIVADLDAPGLLEKTEDYVVQTPVSSRSGAVIEPLISPQWYVSMKPLAEPAVAAVKRRDGPRSTPSAGRTSTSAGSTTSATGPSAGSSGGATASPSGTRRGPTAPATRPPSSSSVDSPGPGYVQDDDTLDTWFSSWLWPFATLGWPETAQDGGPMPAMQAFYPASGPRLGARHPLLLDRAHDHGGPPLYGRGPVPRRLRDGHGEGQAGPQDVQEPRQRHRPARHERTSTAPTRSASRCATLCAQGQDIKLDPSGFEGGRNFANKLWNAFNVFGRFLETDAAGHPTDRRRAVRPRRVARRARGS